MNTYNRITYWFFFFFLQTQLLTENIRVVLRIMHFPQITCSQFCVCIFYCKSISRTFGLRLITFWDGFFRSQAQYQPILPTNEERSSDDEGESDDYNLENNLKESNLINQMMRDITTLQTQVYQM